VNRRLVEVWGTVLAVLILAAGILYAIHRPTFHGTVINPPSPAPALNLTATNGQSFTLNGQHGKVVLLYFGYTNCQDECPATMAKLKLMMGILGNLASNVQVAMVTTDPARDTQAPMEKWMTGFYPTFLGLLGSTDQLQAAYKGYGVTVEKGGETHTTYLYIIDPKGNLRLTYNGPDIDPQLVADDVQNLIKGY
jgi:protein SCO1/2